MKKPYVAPTIIELGSLQALTQQMYNKIGLAPDSLTSENSNVVGSLVPIP